MWPAYIWATQQNAGIESFPESSDLLTFSDNDYSDTSLKCYSTENWTIYLPFAVIAGLLFISRHGRRGLSHYLINEYDDDERCEQLIVIIRIDSWTEIEM